jgi:putative Holliday junction resolvase
MTIRGNRLTKILSIDVGEKRVGLATTDEMQLIAAPFGFLERKTAMENILSIIKQENIGQIVIGIPFILNGRLGSQAQDVQNFITELRGKTKLGIDFENEVLSSVEASNRLKAMKRKIKHKGEVDAMAATIILESYMNGRKN